MPRFIRPVSAALLAADHRSAANKARDQDRHPAETLTFFGLKPDIWVVDVWPGGGWSAEIGESDRFTRRFRKPL